jgi:hypothetical protein
MPQGDRGALADARLPHQKIELLGEIGISEASKMPF